MIIQATAKTGAPGEWVCAPGFKNTYSWILQGEGGGMNRAQIDDVSARKGVWHA